MSVYYRGRLWDVNGDGVACIVTPGLPASTETPVPSSQMDKEIERMVERKNRLIQQRDRVQAELDGITTAHTNLVALRETVTSEP